jgi:hypothetical protein
MSLEERDGCGGDGQLENKNGVEEGGDNEEGEAAAGVGDEEGSDIWNEDDVGVLEVRDMVFDGNGEAGNILEVEEGRGSASEHSELQLGYMMLDVDKNEDRGAEKKNGQGEGEAGNVLGVEEGRHDFVSDIWDGKEEVMPQLRYSLILSDRDGDVEEETGYRNLDLGDFLRSGGDEENLPSRKNARSTLDTDEDDGVKVEDGSNDVEKKSPSPLEGECGRGVELENVDEEGSRHGDFDVPGDIGNPDAEAEEFGHSDAGIKKLRQLEASTQNLRSDYVRIELREKPLLEKMTHIAFFTDTDQNTEEEYVRHNDIATERASLSQSKDKGKKRCSRKRGHTTGYDKSLLEENIHPRKRRNYYCIEDLHSKEKELALLRRMWDFTSEQLREKDARERIRRINVATHAISSCANKDEDIHPRKRPNHYLIEELSSKKMISLPSRRERRDTENMEKGRSQEQTKRKHAPEFANGHYAVDRKDIHTRERCKLTFIEGLSSGGRRPTSPRIQYNVPGQNVEEQYDTQKSQKCQKLQQAKQQRQTKEMRQGQVEQQIRKRQHTREQQKTETHLQAQDQQVSQEVQHIWKEQQNKKQQPQVGQGIRVQQQTPQRLKRKHATTDPKENDGIHEEKICPYKRQKSEVIGDLGTKTKIPVSQRRTPSPGPRSRRKVLIKNLLPHARSLSEGEKKMDPKGTVETHQVNIKHRNENREFELDVEWSPGQPGIVLGGPLDVRNDRGHTVRVIDNLPMVIACEDGPVIIEIEEGKVWVRDAHDRNIDYTEDDDGTDYKNPSRFDHDGNILRSSTTLGENKSSTGRTSSRDVDFDDLECPPPVDYNILPWYLIPARIPKSTKSQIPHRKEQKSIRTTTNTAPGNRNSRAHGSTQTQPPLRPTSQSQPLLATRHPAPLNSSSISLLSSSKSEMTTQNSPLHQPTKTSMAWHAAIARAKAKTAAQNATDSTKGTTQTSRLSTASKKSVGSAELPSLAMMKARKLIVDFSPPRAMKINLPKLTEPTSRKRFTSDGSFSLPTAGRISSAQPASALAINRISSEISLSPQSQSTSKSTNTHLTADQTMSDTSIMFAPSTPMSKPGLGSSILEKKNANESLQPTNEAESPGSTSGPLERGPRRKVEAWNQSVKLTSKPGLGYSILGKKKEGSRDAK